MHANDIIAQGQAADRICSDPVYQAAWDGIMTDLFKAWAESAIGDVEGRERMRLELDVLQRLKSKFHGYMVQAEIEKGKQDQNPSFE